MKYGILLFLLLFPGCNMKKEIKIQGHRGARGLYPENSVPGFLKTLEMGITTLEMDVVVSKDGKILLSHEPFFSSEICLDSTGNPIPPEKEKEFNIYMMDYEEIEKFDCGKTLHPRFPQQQKISVFKPLLKEVIRVCEEFGRNKNTFVYYNIETKSQREGDNIFHPTPDKFALMLYTELKNLNILSRVILQSFDVRTLKELKKLDGTLTLALLVENELSFQQNIDSLGFIPQIYSPYYKFVNEDLVKDVHSKNMKIIPWTVNEEADMLQMRQLGVDEIITDYPDRVLRVLN